MEERLLCLLARQELDQQTLAAVNVLSSEHTIDWMALLALAEQHFVTPLLFRNLRRCVDAGLAIPDEVLHLGKLGAIENAIQQTFRRQKVCELVAYLHGEGIRTMLVKSIALRESIYQGEWYTTSEDIDLLIDRPKAAVSAQQRAKIADYDAFGIECDAFAHHDLTMNGILPVDFEQIWRNARPISFDGYPVYLMAPEDMLITLCIGSARKRFFRLKTMFDIAELIKASPTLDWSRLMATARRYDVTMVVYTALYITQRYLIVPLPDSLLADLQVHSIRKWLIRRLCDRMSLSAATHPRGATHFQLLGREVSPSVALRYLTLHWYQIGRQMRFMWQTPQAQFEFWDGD